MQAKASFFFAVLFSILFFQAVVASPVLAKADAGPAQTLNEGDTVVLDGSKSKLPGGIDTYQWQQTSGTPLVTLLDADKARASFTAPDVGVGGTTLTFQLTVSNSSGKSDTDATTVTIRFVNNPPIANAGIEETGSNPFIQPHSMHHFFHIGSGLLANIGEGIGKRYLQG